MTSTDLQAELAPVKRRDKEAQAAWRAASLVYQDASVWPNPRTTRQTCAVRGQYG